MELTNEAYKKAIEVLKKNCQQHGFKASTEHYNSVWSRDGVITILGALLAKDKKLIETSKKTLETLERGQTKYGMIPNVFFINEKSYKHYAMDANSWWVIGVFEYFKFTQDKEFLEKTFPSVKKAVEYTKYHVIDNSSLLTTVENSDWMDSSIGRRGKLLYTNCLFYKALECANQLAEILGQEQLENPKAVKEAINDILWPHSIDKQALFTWQNKYLEEAINPSRKHYINCVSFEYYEDRCDVFGNILAILFGITDKERETKLLDYFSEKQVSTPYPVKVLNPPALYPNPIWNPKLDLYRREEQRNIPFCYHNAGIWPYVGGFYVLMLAKCGKNKEAEKELEKLALANKAGKKYKWEFNEWMHGKTGEPRGAVQQAWSAAGYIIAYNAVIENKLIW